MNNLFVNNLIITIKFFLYFIIFNDTILMIKLNIFINILIKKSNYQIFTEREVYKTKWRKWEYLFCGETFRLIG